MIAGHLKKCNKYTDYEKVMYWMDFGNMTDRGQVVLGTVGKEYKQPDKEEAVAKLRTVTEFFDMKAVNDEDSGPSCSLAAALSRTCLSTRHWHRSDVPCFGRCSRE